MAWLRTSCTCVLMEPEIYICSHVRQHSQGLHLAGAGQAGSQLNQDVPQQGAGRVGGEAETTPCHFSLLSLISQRMFFSTTQLARNAASNPSSD